VEYVEGEERRLWKERQKKFICYYKEKEEEEEMKVESRVWKWLKANVADNSVEMCKELVMDMLRIDPKKRPTAEQVKNRLKVLAE
jgi:hypothetical protein